MDFMPWRKKVMAALLVMSDSITLILMRIFLPELRLVGGLQGSIGAKAMPQKPQKLVLIMPVSIGCSMKFILSRPYATVVRNE